MTIDKLLKQFRKDWKDWVVDYLWSDECFDFDMRADVAREEMEELFKHAYNAGKKSERKELIRIAQQSMGFHCKDKNCDHNLEQFIKVINQL